jgi:hypothetical protein
MSILPRIAIVVASTLALAFAGWACSSSSVATGATGGTGDTGATCTGTRPATDAAVCMLPSQAPSPPPKKTCDPCKDVYTECPLPPSQMADNGGWTTVYYFADPACLDGVCTYCMTETQTEDPCTTGVCH